MDKKKYSADELLMYAYKYNKIPCVLFAKDKHCRYIYTSEVSRQADHNMYKDKELMHAVNAQIKDCMDNRSGGLRQYG